MSDDLSELMGKLNNMINSDSSGELKNLINNFTSNSSSDNSSNTSGNDSNNTNNNTNENHNFDIDFDTILKLKNIMEAFNSKKNDPRANLLLSLKPYLKESRKSKLDQYVQLLNMSNVFELLKDSGGDLNSNIK